MQEKAADTRPGLGHFALRPVAHCNKFTPGLDAAHALRLQDATRQSGPAAMYNDTNDRTDELAELPLLPDRDTLLAAIRNPSRADAAARTSLAEALPGPELDSAALLARRMMNAPVAGITLVEADRVFVITGQGSEQLSNGHEMAIGDSFCAYTVATGGPFVVSNAQADARLRNLTAVRALDLVAYAGVPIRVGAGSPIGALAVYDRTPRQWDGDGIDLLEHLAVVLGALVEAQAALHGREN